MTLRDLIADRTGFMILLAMVNAYVCGVVIGLTGIGLQVVYVLAEWTVVALVACAGWYVMRQRQDRERIEQEQDDGII